MKKLFFTLAIMLGLATTVSAQEVGQMWIGGSIGFNSTKVGDGDRVSSYRIIPEIGYAFAENMGVGIKLGYAHNKSVAGLRDAVAKDAFTVNPFLRMAFLKGEMGSLFVDGGAGYTYAKTEAVEGAGSTKLNAWEVGFRPGVAVNVSKRITLTGKFGFLGYQHAKVGDIKTDDFGFDFDLGQTELGVSLVF
ncbi:MAG: outer membrane beta-barrel protein [Dysgonomonas sp.]